MALEWIPLYFLWDSQHTILSIPNACLITAVGSCMMWTLYQRYFSDLSRIPGPYLASVTRLWHVCVIMQGKQNLRIKALHEKHGPFVRIAPNEVSVCHPDGSRKLLRESHEKGNWYRVTAVPDFRFQNPMSTTDPGRKKGLSKHFAEAYTPKRIKEYMPGLDKNIRNFLDKLNEDIRIKRPMKLDECITRLTFDNVCWALFSKTFGLVEQGRDIGGTLRNNVALSKFAAVAGFYISILRFLVNPLTSWMFVLPMGQLYNTTARALKERQTRDGTHRDMVEYWIKSGALTSRQIEAQANVNVGAGAEPVSAAVQSVIYHLIQHPNALRLAREELDNCSLDRIWLFEELNKMTYFQACIKEALRMFSPTTMGLPRVAPKEGITFGRQSFRGGTILSVSPHAVHTSTSIWGADAARFRPERWLITDKERKELQQRNWLVFSAGYMSCPGRHLAMIQISKVSALLLRNYDIRLADPNREWDYQANFTSVPHSWPVYLEKRFPVEAEHCVPKPSVAD